MFPFNFEWVWDGSHMVFMGGLWYAIGILGAGMGWVLAKSFMDTIRPGDDDHGDGHH